MSHRKTSRNTEQRSVGITYDPKSGEVTVQMEDDLNITLERPFLEMLLVKFLPTEELPALISKKFYPEGRTAEGDTTLQSLIRELTFVWQTTGDPRN